MIYKIQSNCDYNILEIIDKIKKYYNMIYYNNVLYIATKKINQEKVFEKTLKKFFKPNKNFLFTEINENNLKNENNLIMEWCKNIFVDLDVQKFENDNQDKLKEYLFDLDILEEKLKKELKRKEDGNANGK